MKPVKLVVIKDASHKPHLRHSRIIKIDFWRPILELSRLGFAFTWQYEIGKSDVRGDSLTEEQFIFRRFSKITEYNHCNFPNFVRYRGSTIFECKGNRNFTFLSYGER